MAVMDLLSDIALDAAMIAHYASEETVRAACQVYGTERP
jgi:hypothetical protein